MVVSIKYNFLDRDLECIEFRIVEVGWWTLCLYYCFAGITEIGRRAVVFIAGLGHPLCCVKYGIAESICIIEGIVGKIVVRLGEKIVQNRRPSGNLARINTTNNIKILGRIRIRVFDAVDGYQLWRIANIVVVDFFICKIHKNIVFVTVLSFSARIDSTKRKWTVGVECNVQRCVELLGFG